MENKTTHEELTEEIILEKLKNELKNERDQVTIENVYPSMLEEIFGWDTSVIQIVGGRDLDYEGSFDKYTFSGSAYYGYCSFYLNEEFIDDLSDEDEAEDEPKNDTEDSKETKVSEMNSSKKDDIIFSCLAVLFIPLFFLYVFHPFLAFLPLVLDIAYSKAYYKKWLCRNI